MEWNEMQTTTAKAVYAYWSKVRGGRDVPNRRDIEPADLRQFLPDLFILEPTPGAGTAFRLAGTRLCALFGRELRATDFQGLFAPEVRARMSRICTSMMAQRMPAALQANAHGRSLQPATIEILLLPMTSYSSHADRIFGVLCPINPIQPLEVPFRYMTLESVSNIDPERETAEPHNRSPIRPASVMAVSKQDFGQAVRRVLHLRVFDGGK